MSTAHWPVTWQGQRESPFSGIKKGILFKKAVPLHLSKPFVPRTQPSSVQPRFVCVCVCVLQDYELKFGLWDKHAKNTWHGGVATIQYRPGAEVWGVVWTLSNDNLTSLDKWGTRHCRPVPEGNGWRFSQTRDRCLCVCVLSQEGVSLGKYSPLEVTVETDQGMIQCRTYQINNFYACPPSPQYKRVSTQTPKPRQTKRQTEQASVCF